MNKKIKVCIINFQRYEQIINKSTYEHAARISNRVIVQNTCVGPSKTKILSGMRIYPIFRRLYNKFLDNSIGQILNFILFYRFLRKKRPHIVHVHNAFPGGFIALAARLLNIPIICTSHGMDILMIREIGYGLRLKKMGAILVKLILKFATLHTVVSKSMIKPAIEAGSNREKIRVVYNGIDLKSIIPSVEKEILKQYKIREEDFIILFVGNLEPRKCPDDLIKSFQIVLKEIPNAKLIFTGKGKEENHLKRLASKLKLKERVIFTGLVFGNRKWDLFTRCDVFVLPSIIEGHPNVVIEAMACSKPVVLTNTGPHPEMIKDGESGFLVPLHSIDAIANAIIELALDEKKREKMGKNARKIVERELQINKITNDYLKVYREAIIKRIRKK